MMTQQPLFPLDAPPPPAKVVCTPANYEASCRARYGASQYCLADAFANWDDFEEQRAAFRAWVAHYKKDPWFKVGTKCHNESGRLAELPWLMQPALEPDRSYLHPCLDFEERHQKVFVRRGLVIYLTLLLKELEA